MLLLVSLYLPWCTLCIEEFLKMEVENYFGNLCLLNWRINGSVLTPPFFLFFFLFFVFVFPFYGNHCMVFSFCETKRFFPNLKFDFAMKILVGEKIYSLIFSDSWFASLFESAGTYHCWLNRFDKSKQLAQGDGTFLVLAAKIFDNEIMFEKLKTLQQK